MLIPEFKLDQDDTHVIATIHAPYVKVRHTLPSIYPHARYDVMPTPAPVSSARTSRAAPAVAPRDTPLVALPAFYPNMHALALFSYLLCLCAILPQYLIRLQFAHLQPAITTLFGCRDEDMECSHTPFA